MAKLDLLQGTLDLLILKTLSLGPMHGYAIVRSIKEVSDGNLSVEEGALYPALHRMDARGWISSEWGLSENNRKAKYYQLSPAGRKRLTSQTSRWRQYAIAVEQVLQKSGAV